MTDEEVTSEGWNTLEAATAYNRHLQSLKKLLDPEMEIRGKLEGNDATASKPR
jgi:hypothetical protein